MIIPWLWRKTTDVSLFVTPTACHRTQISKVFYPAYLWSLWSLLQLWRRSLQFLPPDWITLITKVISVFYRVSQPHSHPDIFTPFPPIQCAHTPNLGIQKIFTSVSRCPKVSTNKAMVVYQVRNKVCFVVVSLLSTHLLKKHSSMY